MKRVVIIATVLIATGFAPAHAEEKDPLFPLPFTPDFTRGDGWGVALGAGVEYESAYPGSDEFEFEFDIAGAIQWRKGNHLLFWEGLEAGWLSRVRDQWFFQVGVEYEGEREESDSDDGRLDGLDELDDELAGTVEVRYAFDSEWRNWVGARILAGGSDLGGLGLLAAGHRFGSQLDGSGTEVLIFASFGDSDNMNRDFGISAAEAETSGLEETDVDSGYRSTTIRLVDRRYWGDHIHIVSGLEFEWYSSEVQDSPIAREDFGGEVEFALVYQF